MKRALTGIAAASVVLGMSVPTVFAANYSNATWHQETIQIGSTTLGFKGFDALYAGTQTDYMPIYYLIEMLQKDGYQASWNGINKVFSITTPSGVKVDMSQFTNAGQGTASIYLNGQLVQMTDSVVMKDPASGVNTTYMPVYFLLKVLSAIGAASQSNWDGNTETLTLQAPMQASTMPSLSALQFSGESMGTGTSASPAVSSNGAPLTVSTTLTDASGNPVSGISVTFNVWGSSAPTATSNGITLTPSVTTGSSGAPNLYAYSVTTNSNGVATLTLTDGSNAAYTIQAQAPYNNNGVTVTSAKAYAVFGQAGSIVLTPVGTSTSPAAEGFNPSSVASGVVPVTATVIPATSGVSVANVPVTFTFTSVSSSAPYISDASGAYVQPISDGGTTTVYTNASGQAVLYVNANTAASVDISANATVNGTSQSGSTALSWTEEGLASQIVNAPTSTVDGTVGTNLTISGTVEDSLGNPLPNTQILISGYDSGNGDLDYVNGSTSTAFPNVGDGSLVGADANTAFGDLVTTDSNGNFTITLNDSNAETATIYAWGIQNGQIANKLGTYNLNFTNTSSTLNNLYVDTTTSGLENSSGMANDEYTKLTNLEYQAGGSTTQAPVFVGGFAGTQAYTTGTVQYTVSSNNSGYIAAIDGVALNGTNALPNDPSSVIVDVTYSDNSVSQVTVDGTKISPPATSYAATYGTGFTFVPGDNSVQNDTFTVSTGSLSDTVGANFVAGPPAELANVGSFTVSPGQSQTITFTVEDANGNPVPYGSVELQSPITLNNPPVSGNNLWLTSVNNVQLAQTVYGTSGTVYGTQPTPIPLIQAPSQSVIPSLYLQGAVSATGIGTNNQKVNVYAEQNGQVSLTFTAGGNGYWDTSTNSVYGATNSNTGLTVYFSYGSSNGNIVLTTSAPTSNNIGSLSY